MATELTKYENTSGVDGNNSSSMTFVCPWDESAAAKLALIGAVDENDPTLKCQTVRRGYLGGDVHCGQAELVAEFVPSVKVDRAVVDQSFKWRFEGRSEAITVGDGTKIYFKWAGDSADVPAAVVPTVPFTSGNIVLFGSRTTVEGVWDSYLDTVNSDVFLGCAAGTVRFATFSLNPRQAADGSDIFDVEIHLEYKSTGWNKMLRPDTNVWDTILSKSSDDPLIPETAYAGLLTAPGA